MSPIPPYTPKGGGGNPPAPSTPPFDTVYDADSNEIIITSDGDLSGITALEMYVTDYDNTGGLPGYSTFDLDTLQHINEHELRIRRAYQIFFNYEPNHSYSANRGELFGSSLERPDFVWSSPTPVTIDNLASTDPIDVYIEPIGGALTVQAQVPVDFSAIEYMTCFTETNASYQFSTNDFFMLDPQAIQLFDPSSMSGETIIGIEFAQADQGVIPYIWIGSVLVP